MSQKRTIETDIFGAKVSDDRINSRRKGSSNENRVAKVLSQWAGVPFTRVPRSGGLRWKDTANVCGDVVCEVQAFNFPFSVETKHYKSVKLPIKFCTLEDKRSIVYTFWDQCLDDAARAKKRPLMLIRQNGMRVGEYYLFIDFKLDSIMPVANGVVKGNKIYLYLSTDVFSTPFEKIVSQIK